MQQWQKQRKQQQHQQQEQEQKKRQKQGTSVDGRRNGEYKKKNQRRRADEMRGLKDSMVRYQTGRDGTENNTHAQSSMKQNLPAPNSAAPCHLSQVIYRRHLWLNRKRSVWLPHPCGLIGSGRFALVHPGSSRLRMRTRWVEAGAPLGQSSYQYIRRKTTCRSDDPSQHRLGRASYSLQGGMRLGPCLLRIRQRYREI